MYGAVNLFGAEGTLIPIIYLVSYWGVYIVSKYILPLTIYLVNSLYIWYIKTKYNILFWKRKYKKLTKFIVGIKSPICPKKVIG